MAEIIPKGLEALLKEDRSLQNKLTFEEYKSGKSVPGNSDYQIENVYKEYRSFLEKGTKE